MRLFSDYCSTAKWNRTSKTNVMKCFKAARGERGEYECQSGKSDTHVGSATSNGVNLAGRWADGQRNSEKRKGNDDAGNKAM